MLDPLDEHPAPYYYGYRGWLAHQREGARLRARSVAHWRNGTLAREFPTLTGPWLAAQMMRVLEVLQRGNPAVWAANQRVAYTLLLRWCVVRQPRIPPDEAARGIAERCYYELGLFRRWEAAERSRGMLTSRHIEKGLRWDRVSDSYRGMEFRAIRRYVKGLSRPQSPLGGKREK